MYPTNNNKFTSLSADEQSELLKQCDPLLASELEFANASLNVAVETHRAVRSKATNDEVQRLKLQIQELDSKAQNSVIKYSLRPIVNPPPLSSLNLDLSNGNNGSDYNFDQALVVEQQQIQTKENPHEEHEQNYLAIALALRNGHIHLADIANATKLRPYYVAMALADAEFRNQLPEFFVETETETHQEAQLLVGMQKTIERVIFERAISAMNEDEITDFEMQALGISPLSRNASLASQPGGKSGFMVLEPISVAVQTTSGIKKVTEFLVTLDHKTIQAQMKIAQRLTELTQAGLSSHNKNINMYAQRSPQSQPQLVNVTEQ